MTYFDTGKTKDTGLLALQPFVNLVGIVTVDVRLLHEGERDTVVAFAESSDFTVITRLLSTELHWA